MFDIRFIISLPFVWFLFLSSLLKRSFFLSPYVHFVVRSFAHIASATMQVNRKKQRADNNNHYNSRKKNREDFIVSIGSIDVYTE